MEDVFWTGWRSGWLSWFLIDKFCFSRNCIFMYTACALLWYLFSFVVMSEGKWCTNNCAKSPSAGWQLFLFSSITMRASLSRKCHSTTANSNAKNFGMAQISADGGIRLFWADQATIKLMKCGHFKTQKILDPGSRGIRHSCPDLTYCKTDSGSICYGSEILLQIPSLKVCLTLFNHFEYENCEKPDNVSRLPLDKAWGVWTEKYEAQTTMGHVFQFLCSMRRLSQRQQHILYKSIRRKRGDGNLSSSGIQSGKQFGAKSKQGTWTRHAPPPVSPALGVECEIWKRASRATSCWTPRTISNMMRGVLSANACKLRTDW